MLLQIDENEWIETLDILRIKGVWMYVYPNGRAYTCGTYKDEGGPPEKPALWTDLHFRNKQSIYIACHPQALIKVLDEAGIAIAGNPKFGY